MEDRELQAFVRRAKSSVDRKGHTRRSALKQLVSSTHSSSSTQAKIFAALNIPEFFLDFPDFEEDAINAVYDLCEDTSSQVRLEGYRALGWISRLEKKWVKRNADVLVQLLQSDEPNEVTMVRKTLVEHLHLDPRVTLGVLVDQIAPLPDQEEDQDQDQEELAMMRDSLRRLVLAFIASEVKKEYGMRYVGDAQEVLVDGLLSAIPKLTDPSDVSTIINDILVHLKFIDTPSPRGRTLAALAFANAKKALSEDHLSARDSSSAPSQTLSVTSPSTSASISNSITSPTSPSASTPTPIPIPTSASASTFPSTPKPTPTLPQTLPYLPTLSTLYIHKNQGVDPHELLTMTFYPSIVGNKMVFGRMGEGERGVVVFYFAEVLGRCGVVDGGGGGEQSGSGGEEGGGRREQNEEGEKAVRRVLESGEDGFVEGEGEEELFDVVEEVGAGDELWMDGTGSVVGECAGGVGEEG
ncbi:hypothetical protein GYMLUDRAFT_53796 [Collybiopsis luxurians FD-317 M1]|nr:hypothetical protein GYMLUDRAFT_53796 [Collybiopsis luxurians FD-317 M1]